MKSLTLLLLLSISLATISRAALFTNELGMVYVAPMPAPPVLTPEQPFVSMKLQKSETFTVECYHCGKLQRRLTPNFIKPGSVTAGTDGTNIITRTVILDCRDCCGSIISKTVKRVPIPIAVEDEHSGGLGGGTTQTWTIDPNLRVTVEVTNCPAPLFGVGLNQILDQAFIGNLPVLCGKTALIKFPTEIGKVYKCQASDDNRAPGDPMKVWLDGLPMTGTGGMVMQAEAADKPKRVYRVLEQPL